MRLACAYSRPVTASPACHRPNYPPLGRPLPRTRDRDTREEPEQTSALDKGSVSQPPHEMLGLDEFRVRRLKGGSRSFLLVDAEVSLLLPTRPHVHVRPMHE